MQSHRENKRIIEDKTHTEHNRYQWYKRVVIIKRYTYAKATFIRQDYSAHEGRNHDSSCPFTPAKHIVAAVYARLF